MPPPLLTQHRLMERPSQYLTTDSGTPPYPEHELYIHTKDLRVRKARHLPHVYLLFLFATLITLIPPSSVALLLQLLQDAKATPSLSPRPCGGQPSGVI